MSLILTGDEESLRDSVRRFVADRTPLSAVRELIAAGEPYDTGIWKQLSAQLGVAGLAIPEEYGGAGAGHAAMAVALQELGAGLVPSPLLASAVLAAGALLALDDMAAREALLPGIASGEAVATLALTGPAAAGPGARAAGAGVRAVGGAGVRAVGGAGGAARLFGEVAPVLNGAQASALLIPASGPDGLAVYLVDGAASGLTRVPLTTADPTRALARITLADTPARALAGNAASALSTAADLANLALAAEQCGAMAACLAMTTEYAKLRVAFGQPIGAFQGVKHRLADMETAWELGHAALRSAARSADESPADFPRDAAAARVLISGPYFTAAADTIELHGGIGFTWEHDAHLYYKNALSGKVLLGGPGDQLDRLASELGM
ncbi:MAG TPA: acyl-CoA dehydrogenase family protein [Streptosporangiaceae bacterium]|nr:acyl-CoA dehydrogenase family protein [Streptosporangiaceae bacterium]